MTRPKLFLAPHTTLRGNRAHEWRGTSAAIRSSATPAVRGTTSGQVPPERRAGAFWAWLVSLTREAARGQAFRPGGRVGW